MGQDGPDTQETGHSSLKRIAWNLILPLFVAGTLLWALAACASSTSPQKPDGEAEVKTTTIGPPQPAKVKEGQTPAPLSPEERERLEKAVDETHLPGPELPEGTPPPKTVGTPKVPESKVGGAP